MKYMERWEQYAPEAYNTIRGTADDIVAIARTTGWAEFRIRRIKDHIFYRQHQLDDRFDCFDPDPDIADAWFRLQQGNYLPEDLRLLEHEYFESRFEVIFNTDYRTAHNATLNSGRLWSPPEA
ncbi:hypothetical protein [Anabaena azotica]|uniref:Uncharacterized protein n=1 Tax=Anabaena azotica FACHB-119 TaxID=947527 RepID=A0ABR8DEN5_9NOST|nr:hypothetical protein [Anabaena azotica]MBD2504173.1 hypothetical protein [Anabaena azotica FACHB-119]